MSDRARRNVAAQRRAKQRKRMVAIGLGGALAVIVIVVAFASRGGDDATGPQLSELGRLGKETAVKRSCVGCHGRSGEGGGTAGPKWVGLYGSTVSLDDGSMVVADRAYLIESIVDPHAKQVAGYPQKMPVDSIPEADVLAMVQYIEELAAPAPTTVP
jgi:mono/diheme cytochrome c family protein